MTITGINPKYVITTEQVGQQLRAIQVTFEPRFLEQLS